MIRDLVISEPIKATLFTLSYCKKIAEEGNNKVLFIDNKGIASNSLDFKKIRTDQFNIFSIRKIDLTFLIDSISAIVELDHEQKSHLKYSLINSKDKELDVEKLIEKIASSTNPFLTIPSHLAKIEDIISKLSDIKELDIIFRNTNILNITKELDREDCIILNNSFLTNSKSKLLATMLTVGNLIFNKEDNTDIILIVDNVEGKSFLDFEKDLVLKMLDLLSFKKISYCFTSTFEELNEATISRFSKIYYISYNSLFKLRNNLVEDSYYNLMVVEDNQIIKKERFEFDFEYEYSTGTNLTNIKGTKSLLELNYKGLANAIADLIIELERNIVRRNEIKPLMLSMGYFIEDWDNFIDILINDGILEEKMFSGIRKLVPTYKGIFMAKEHKKLNESS